VLLSTNKTKRVRCVSWGGMHDTHPKAILGWRRVPLVNLSGKESDSSTPIDEPRSAYSIS